mgnify:CR=1 FL=1
MAQRSVDFGCKDRIFEQNDLLSDPIDARQATLAALVAMARPSVKSNGQPGLPNRRGVQAMGSACHDAIYPDVTTIEKTPVQQKLERMGDVTVPGEKGWGRPAARHSIC